MKKYAFTLAEVLITLAIIGVIAAITIPSIVANHQKRTLETQFAKAYRTISQAVNLAIAEHGDISTWDWGEGLTEAQKTAIVEKYLLPYLNVMKFCPASTPQGCAPDEMYKLLSGANWTNLNTRKHPKALLADGSIIEFNFGNACITNAGWCLATQIDINGAKKPNAVGRDVFQFNFYSQTGEFFPSGIYRDDTYDKDTNTYVRRTAEELRDECNSEVKVGGWSCAARIVADSFKINY